MILYVTLLPDIWMKQKKIFFNYERKYKINYFNHNKLNFNLKTSAKNRCVLRTSEQFFSQRVNNFDFLLCELFSVSNG